MAADGWMSGSDGTAPAAEHLGMNDEQVHSDAVLAVSVGRACHSHYSGHMLEVACGCLLERMANIAVVRQQQRAVFAPATTVRNNLCGGARKRDGSGIESTGPHSVGACPRDVAT
jgi:hypothetical protein